MGVEIPPGLQSLQATRRLCKAILSAYLIILIVIRTINAFGPFTSTMHKRLSATSTASFIDSKRVHSSRHCSQRCSQTPNCTAFNVIRMEPSNDSPGLECEMFSAVDPTLLVDDMAAVVWGKCGMFCLLFSLLCQLRIHSWL